MFLINLIFYAMVTGTNYHRTHPGESKFQAGITYNNVRIFICSIVFCLGLAIMKKMKKLASKWIITWAILCTVFLIVMSFCEIENAYVSFSTADQAEKYYGIEKNKNDILEQINKELSEKWEFSRLSKISIAILKLAVYEILYKKLPYKVVINEAVELAKAYGDDNAPSFVNGILASIVKNNNIEYYKG